MQYEKKSSKITGIFRNRLFLLFAVIFLLTIILLSTGEIQVAKKSATQELSIQISDVINDISALSDNNLERLTKLVLYDYETISNYTDEEKEFVFNNPDYSSLDYDTATLMYIKDIYDLSELNKVDPNGIITSTTNSNFIGFDLHSGAQSMEFVDKILIGGETCYVQSYQPIAYDNKTGMKYSGISTKDGGLLQIGYDADKFRLDIDNVIYGVTKNRHVGREGFIVIVTEDGEIVSSPNTDTLGKNSETYGLPVSVLEEKANGEVFIGSINETEYFTLGSKVEGYYIFGHIPYEETISSLKLAILVTDAIQLVAFGIIFLLVFDMIRRLVVKNISKIATSLEKIAKGDLDVEVDVRGTQEFESLSDSINATVHALRESAEKEVDRINSELEYAKNIQRSALPMLFPPFPDRTEFEIYATMDPAKEVGGDFFDFDLMSNNLLGFCVADVSGKGIPAALFMMRAKTLIKSYGVAGLSADAILAAVNKELCSNNESDMFVTCWLGILNTETGTIEYANAGHNPPLIRRKDGSYEYLSDGRANFVLAGMENVKYSRREVSLGVGDEIFLYTDGVTEATSSDNELFGEARLRDALNASANESCENQCLALREAIDAFVQDAPQFDDITMLSLKFFGSENVITVDADMKNYDSIIEYIDSKLENMSCPMAVQTKFNIAADELISNIIKFAYGDAIGKLSVKVESCKDAPGASITFLDRGIPFNPLESPDPDITLSVEDRTIGSLGLFMVKKLMDKVEYEYSYGNKLKITKYY